MHDPGAACTLGPTGDQRAIGAGMKDNIAVRLGRRLVRPIAAVATTVLMAAVALFAPGAMTAAYANPGLTTAAFQANNGILWTVSTTGAGSPTGLGMLAGTSPYLRPAYNGVELAFQANNGILWTVSNGVGHSTGLAMKPGTSPRGTGAVGDEIAFQGADGTLWTYRYGVGHSTGLRMKPATSPDILPIASGGFWIAYQSDAGQLWVVDPSGAAHSTGRYMRAGSSPDLSSYAFSDTMYVAFQAYTGELWIVDVNGYGESTGLRMMAGTSPAMDANSFGMFGLRGFEVSFQMDTGELWSGWASANRIIIGFPTGRHMRAGTSPAQAVTADGGYAVAFQADTGDLWIVDPHGAGASTGLGMMAGTSPCVVGPLLL